MMSQHYDHLKEKNGITFVEEESNQGTKSLQVFKHLRPNTKKTLRDYIHKSKALSKRKFLL